MIDAELGNEEYDDSFDPEELENMANVEPATLAKKIPKDDLEGIVDDLFKERSKEQAEQKRKQRLALKREMQDETIKRNIQTKLDKRSAYDRRNQLRASAVSQRIQAYSIASSLGFAGYVAASIVDQFGIRPKEKLDIAAEDQYNADYAEYEQSLKADQLERRRQREDEISSMSVSKADIRNEVFNGKPETYQEPTLKPASPKAKDLAEDPKHTSRDRPTRTRSKEFLDTEEELDDYGVPISKSAPTLGPTASSRNTGPGAAISKVNSAIEAIKPVAPVAAVSAIEKYGPIGLAIAAGITVAQQSNQLIDASGKAASELGKSVLTGTATQGLKSVAGTARSIIDPLGINPLAQVSVTGFDTLLSLTESIKNYAEKDKEFSPLTLQASIEGDIARLMQSIELAAKNDPLKAQFTQVYTQLDLAWNEFKAEVFQNIGPAIIGLLEITVASLKAAEGVPTAIYQTAKHTGILWYGIATTLEQIAANTSPDPAFDANLFKEISDFLDPGNFKDMPGRAFKNKIPNPVP